MRRESERARGGRFIEGITRGYWGILCSSAWKRKLLLAVGERLPERLIRLIMAVSAASCYESNYFSGRERDRESLAVVVVKLLMGREISNDN